MPELVEQDVNGFIIERTCEAFVRKLSYVVARREILPEMGARVRAKMKARFDMKHNAAQWTDFLAAALELKRLRQAEVL